MAHPCEGCIDWVPISPTNNHYRHVCDYIGRTGHARSLICPPGEKCTVKTTAPQAAKVQRYDRGGFEVRLPKKRVGAPAKIKPEEVRQMAAQGMSDGQIANKLGFQKNSIWMCRRRNGIPAGRKSRRGVSA